MASLKNFAPVFKFVSKPALFFLFFLTFLGLCIEVLSLGILFPVVNFISGKGVSQFQQYMPAKFSLSDKNVLVFLIILLIVIYLIRLLYMTYLNWRQNKFIQDLNARIIDKLYGNYLNQRYADILIRDSSVYMKNIQVEMVNFSTGITAAFFLVAEFATIISTQAVLFVVDPLNTLIVTVYILALSFVFYKIFKSKISRLGLERQQVTERTSLILNNSLSGLKDIVLSHSQPFFLRPFAYLNQRQAAILTNVNTLNALPRYFLEFIAVGAICIIVLIYSFMGKLGVVVPLLAIFSAAAFRLIPSFNRCVTFIQQFRYTMPSIELIMHELNYFDYANTPHPQVSNPGSFTTLKIEEVSVMYPKSDTYVLDKFSLEVPVGKSIGIFGPSGSGKSTLLDLILGLHIPVKGDIKVNDQSIYQNMPGWRSRVGYVSQNIYLIHDTILRNVAFGIDDDQIDLEQVKKVVKEASLEDFMSALPEGLDTVVGERGVRLSGGQKQRLAIARALYTNPEILIFDEASSALDVEMEKQIMSEINILKGKKTLIIVAHRLSTLSNCDYVYELRAGKIVNSGLPQDTIKIKI